MASSASHVDLHPALKSLLGGLRRRIRIYVWVEGVSLALIWLGMTFWTGFAIDYLPVLAGANEMPRSARLIMLLAVAAVFGWLLWHFIFRRAFAPLSDRSLALVLERRFLEFKDSLLTSVELTGASPTERSFNPEMLEHTELEALAKTAEVEYSRVFNFQPLVRNLAVAAGLATSILIFFAAYGGTAGKAAARLYLLNDDRWVRQAMIEILGVDLERPPAPGTTTPTTIPLQFEDRVIKVAKGSNLRLKVRADSGTGVGVVPRTCTVYYRTEPSGDYPSESGRVILSKYRELPDGRQFWSEGKPFVGILSSVRFDVVGYDYRIRDYRIEIVESPAVVETLVDLKYPDYMVDEALSSHLPANDQPYIASGTSYPVGTDVTLKFRTNKPLKKAVVRNVDSGTETVVAAGDESVRFTHRIAPLKESQSLEIILTDTDNVTTDRPYRVLLAAIPDESPKVEITMRGIGQAVTPDVVIPLDGKATDDYGVAKAWIELLLGEAQPRQLPLAVGKAGAVEHRLDFRQLRSADEPIALRPKDKLTLGINAEDKYNLEGAAQIGSGDRRQLDVVTPEELLSQLEVRELSLRRRFEQIIDETIQLRDSLLRVKASLTGAESGKEPGDSSGDPGDKPLTPEQLSQRERELRLLRVQRGVQQSEKSRQETSGTAEAFLDIREELINNRVDTEERKARLKDLIAVPLQNLAAVQFPELDRRLVALEKGLDDSSAGMLADAGIEQANAVLAEMDQVLQKMLDLETFNELVDLVRDLLKSQEDLLDRTKQERKRQALEDLK